MDDDHASFRLTKDGKCPFLNRRNLCELILVLGEESLCQICTDHPRFYNCLPGLEEVGVGLCCEAAADLILNPSVENTLIFSSDINFPDEMHKLPEAIEAQIQLLNSVDSFCAVWSPHLRASESPLAEEWAELFYKEKTVQRICQFLLKQEIIKEEWRKTLKDLINRLPQILSAREEFFSANPNAKQHYPRLLHYFFYRYLFCTVIYEENDLLFESVLSDELRFCFLCVGMIHLLDILHWLKSGTFCFADQISVCKLFSQEVEYDDEIVSALHSLSLI